MVIWRFVIDRVGLLAEVGSKRAVQRVAKGIHEIVGTFWHRVILPRHWRKGARERYGHQQRTAKYQRRKLNAFFYGGGGKLGRPEAPDRDLLWSGLMRRSLMEFGRVRAYPTRFSVTMHGPRYVGMRPFRTGMPNMGAELTTVTEDEQQEMAEEAEAHLPQLIQENKTRVRETVG